MIITGRRKESKNLFTHYMHFLLVGKFRHIIGWASNAALSTNMVVWVLHLYFSFSFYTALEHFRHQQCHTLCKLWNIMQSNINAQVIFTVFNSEPSTSSTYCGITQPFMMYIKSVMREHNYLLIAYRVQLALSYNTY